jgi:hypothetical protein
MLAPALSCDFTLIHFRLSSSTKSLRWYPSINDRFKMRIERRSLRFYWSSIHTRTLAHVFGINLANVAPIAHSLTIATDRMIQR